MGYHIYAGLSGGFGGATYSGYYDVEDKAEAESYAREIAIEEYQSYEGYHGILSEYECAQELYGEGGPGDVPEWVWESKIAQEEIREMYIEEIESWIEYYVVEGEEEEMPDEY
jgi:hypothetical protein